MKAVAVRTATAFYHYEGPGSPLRNPEPPMNERRSHHYENSDTRFPGTNANQPWENFAPM
jgi:hypothetical protein